MQSKESWARPWESLRAQGVSESTSLLPVPGSSPQKTWLWCKLHDGFQSQATGGFCPYSWKSEGGAFSWLPRAGTVLSSKKGMMEEVQCKGGMMVARPLPNPHSMPLKLEILVSQQKPSFSHQYSQIWRNASRMGEFFFKVYSASWSIYSWLLCTPYSHLPAIGEEEFCECISIHHLNPFAFYDHISYRGGNGLRKAN